jgi:hypothetical protein
MPLWTTSVVLNADRTKRIGTIYSYDARKNTYNKYYCQEIKELYSFKNYDPNFQWDIQDELIDEIEGGHFQCPRKFDYNEDFDEDKEKERLGHHLNKMELNRVITEDCKGILPILDNVNKRIMNETLSELLNINDNPHTLLGKLCIRMTALEMFEEWDANDFPNIPSYV